MKKNIFTCILALTLFLSACDGVAVREATPTPYPTPVRKTFTVQRGDILVEARLFGRVTPLTLAAVSFEMSGKVSTVFAQPGDPVQAGQLLAELEELGQLTAQARVRRAEIRRAQIALEIEQLALEKLQAENRPEYDIQAQALRVELAQMAFEDVLVKLGIDPQGEPLSDLETDVARARIFAPLDGVILTGVEVGRSVSPNNPSFLIGDDTKLDLVAQIESNRESDMEAMFEGMVVVVTPDSQPDLRLSGKIRQLPAPYGSGPADTRLIYILLDQAPDDETYQIGEKMTVTVTLASKSAILWLPPEAIRTSAGRTFVIVNSPEGPKRIEVQTGLKTTLMVEIVSGLEEGQVVLNP